MIATWATIQLHIDHLAVIRKGTKAHLRDCRTEHRNRWNVVSRSVVNRGTVIAQQHAEVRIDPAQMVEFGHTR